MRRQVGALGALVVLVAFGCGRTAADDGIRPDAGRADAGNDFSGCKYPPSSVCTFAETCAHLDCGGLEYDERGCRRTPCTADGDCAGEERCTALECTDRTSCDYSSGATCLCGGTADCRSGMTCNAVTVVGPRGAWKMLRVQHASGPCPPGTVCTSWWQIGPDGSLSASKSGQPLSSTITARDLDALRFLVDGPELRAQLRDGIDCGQPPTDISITIRLELDTQTLERDVTACALTSQVPNVFGRVDRIVGAY